MDKNYYGGDYVMRLIEHFDLNFCLGNALKYILRAGKKHDRIIEDLAKSVDYVNRQILKGKKYRNILAPTGERAEFADEAITTFNLTGNLNLSKAVEILCSDEAYESSSLITVRLLLEKEIHELEDRQTNETGNHTGPQGQN